MVQTRGQGKAAAREEGRKRKESSTPSRRHALESTTQKGTTSSRPCAQLYSPRSASGIVYARCFKIPSTKEYARFRPALERIGLGGLTYYPWRVRSTSILEELRQVNFAGTAKKKEHRAQYFQWDETVFAEVYGLQASGSGMIERNNEIINRFFPNKRDAISGWLPCQCQDPELRLVFEFITPILCGGPGGRRLISARAAATVAKAWMEPGTTNWAIIFRDRFWRYAAATVGGKSSYVSPFLLHIYYFKGLLTPEEQAAWTCDPLEVARDASNATTATKTVPRPDRAADIRGNETHNLSAADTLTGTEGEGEMDGVHLRSPAPNTPVEVDTAADTDMQSPEDGNASAHETLNTSAAVKAKEGDDKFDFAAKRTACEGGQVSPAIFVDVPVSMNAPSRILEEGREVAAPDRAEKERGGKKEFEAGPSSGRTVLTHRSHRYKGPVRARSVDREVGNAMSINGKRKRQTLHANSFLGIHSNEMLLADEVCKEFGCEAKEALETFQALTQTRAWRDNLSNIRQDLT